MQWRRALVGVLIWLLAGSAALADPVPTTDPLPVDQPAPDFGGSSSPLRPGASLGGYCTFNFVFKESDTSYIGTAGHCTDRIGERVRLGTGRTIGSVVYDSDVAGSDIDFSLIRIDADMVGKTSPRMLGTTGPHGVATPGMFAIGDRIDLYGAGVGFGSIPETRSRFGILANWNTREYAADMPSVNGDSGAPLLHHDTGYALGVVSRYGVAALPPSTDLGPLLTWILREVRDAGFGIQLATP